MKTLFSIINKTIYNKSSWGVRQVINLLHSLISEPPYPFSDFPLIGKKSLFSIRSSFIEKQLSFDNDNDNISYYSRIYNDSRRRAIDLVEENVARTTVEVVPAMFYKKYSKLLKEDMLFHVARSGNFGQLNFEVTNEVQKKEKQTFVLSDNNRFLSFLGSAGDDIKIDASEGLIVSPPIPTKQHIKQKRRLVLFMFVDGLVDRSILGYKNLNSIMPNTADFFNDAFDFRNHYVNSEWTLPSMASIFSGKYTHNHGLFDPKKIVDIGGSYQILSQYFKDNNYTTFNVGGIGRISPVLGYVKGFDRTIYQNSMPVHEVISNFMEHDRIFNKRDKFVFLQFSDLHHNLSVVPDSSVMSNLSPNTLASMLDPFIQHKKSVYNAKNDDKRRIFIERIKRLDFYLKTIYQYVENTYDRNEVSVCLFSDHGQAYLTDDSHPLSDARTKGTWLFKSGDKSGGKVDEYTEAVDIFNTILSDAGIIFDTKIDGQLPMALGGLTERSCTFSQSIYPGQTYKAVINSVDAKYIYSTEMPVDNDGKINHKNATVKIFPEKNIINKILTDNEVKEFIMNKLASDKK
jgi:hypothetical protein